MVKLMLNVISMIKLESKILKPTWFTRFLGGITKVLAAMLDQQMVNNPPGFEKRGTWTSVVPWFSLTKTFIDEMWKNFPATFDDTKG